jgi:putative GTP pyrophosphokinase
MAVRFPDEEFEKLKKILLIYEWGQQTLLTKINIIYEDFKHFQSHAPNPIEHIKSRIKSPESIAEKLQKWGHELTAENAVEHIKDIGGIRIICAYAKDINRLAELLRAMPNVSVLSEKDYITNPKPSGYRGYHFYLETPILHSGAIENVPVEVQIRTASMDFWATLEHNAKYKYNQHVPPHLSDELINCANQIAELDERMFTIQTIITRLNMDNDTMTV